MRHCTEAASPFAGREAQAALQTEHASGEALSRDLEDARAALHAERAGTAALAQTIKEAEQRIAAVDAAKKEEVRALQEQFAKQFAKERAATIRIVEAMTKLKSELAATRRRGRASRRCRTGAGARERARAGPAGCRACPRRGRGGVPRPSCAIATRWPGSWRPRVRNIARRRPRPRLAAMRSMPNARASSRCCRRRRRVWRALPAIANRWRRNSRPSVKEPPRRRRAFAHATSASATRRNSGCAPSKSSRCGATSRGGSAMSSYRRCWRRIRATSTPRRSMAPWSPMGSSPVRAASRRRPARRCPTSPRDAQAARRSATTFWCRSTAAPPG